MSTAATPGSTPSDPIAPLRRFVAGMTELVDPPRAEAEILARGSALMADLQRYVASGEINSRVADVTGATDAVRAWGQTQGVTIDTLDGLTLVHEGGAGDPMWWLNLRASNTEPLLRLNVEAADVLTMQRVRDHVLGIVRGEHL